MKEKENVVSSGIELESIQNTKIESIRSKFRFLPVFGTLSSTQHQAECHISIAITINWAQNLS